jgi:hypothetical protein
MHTLGAVGEGYRPLHWGRLRSKTADVGVIGTAMSKDHPCLMVIMHTTSSEPNDLQPCASAPLDETCDGNPKRGLTP